MDNENEEFDKELAELLRARAREDQGLPPVDSPSQYHLPESLRLLEAVHQTIEVAGQLLNAGDIQRAAITMQMALCTSNVALVRVIQEFSQIYIGLATGTVRVIQVDKQGEEVVADDESSEVC